MKRNLLLSAFLLMSVIGMSAAACAQDEAGEPIKLYMNESKILDVTNPTRIAIGNPDIIDVSSVSRDQLTISPKGVGKTTLVVWDSFGEQSYNIKVYKEDLAPVKERIDNILKAINQTNVHTQIDEEGGRVLLLGHVKTAQERERINIALGALKDKITDLMEIKEEESVIEIAVEVLELDKDASKTLGFTWPGSVTINEIGSPGIPTTTMAQIGTTDTIQTTTSGGTNWGSLFRVLRVSRAAFSLTLDALVQEGKARILSQPRLACQSGKEAELLVGGEKPIFTTQVASAGGSGTQVEYKEYGIKLKIKPTLAKGDQIKLGVNVEVSEVGAVETIGPSDQPTAKAYPLSKRSASTELFLDNGQTLSIGGLVKQKTEETVRKVPFLGDIPIVGAIFRKRDTSTGGGIGNRSDTELFITITPTIVRREGGLAAAKEVKEEIKLSAQTAAQPDNQAVPLAEIPKPPPMVNAADINSLEGYSRLVQRSILDNVSYPVAARQAGFQGTVKLGLHISYSGKLLEAVVKESSGYKVLDEEALSVARNIDTFPPFPASVSQEDIWIEAPISYKLD